MKQKNFLKFCKPKLYQIIAYILLIFLLAMGVSYIKKHLSINQQSSSTIAPLILAPTIARTATISETAKEKISTYRVPILMYHYVRDYNNPNDQIGSKLSVSPSKFDEQMKWFKENGYQSINPSDLVDGSFDFIQKQNHNYMILTFDDGYRDAYTNAFPILQKYGFTATFYLITRNISNPAYLNWDMVKEMKNAGMNFGSHTFSHPDLSKASDTIYERELSKSKEMIEEQIGIIITDFSYPSGKYNEKVMEKLKEFGYKTAVTTHHGIADQDSDLYQLPRIRIENTTDFQSVLEQK